LPRPAPHRPDAVRAAGCNASRAAAPRRPHRCLRGAALPARHGGTRPGTDEEAGFQLGTRYFRRRGNERIETVTRDSEQFNHDGEVDVSNWAVIRDEPGGRDPNKRWITSHADSPRSEHWLWKSRQVTGDGSE